MAHNFAVYGGTAIKLGMVVRNMKTVNNSFILINQNTLTLNHMFGSSMT